MITIVEYDDSLAPEWDQLVNTSPMGTFLHTRKFLGYHGSKFDDKSLLVMNRKGALVGVFPAAVDINDKQCVVSHPGSSFGGVVQNRGLLGERMIATLQAICKTYQSMGYNSLVYKAVPYIYHVTPSGDDLYAMFRCNADIVRCDLSAAIDLVYAPQQSERRRRGYKKAVKSGLTLSGDMRHIDAFWEILMANLENKHNAAPVHTISEIQLLCKLFPGNIRLITAISEGNVVAGILLFVSELVFHAQYIASSEIGYKFSALDLVFANSIECASKEGCRYFDFGISNEDSGRYLNEGLFKFKSEFGASGLTHHFYEIKF